MVKKVKFVISPTGEISIDVSGFTGSSCKEFTSAFEEELGEVKNIEHKDEYYQEEVNESEQNTEE